jgi:hypothetical protein
VSRQNRRSSPRIVGVAKVVNATPPVGVEALRGLDQPEVGDLLEILALLVVTDEPLREVAGQSAVLEHERPGSIAQ